MADDYPGRFNSKRSVVRAVSYSRHAADGPQFIWVNAKIVDDVFSKVKSQHFSEDQTAAIRFIAYIHHLDESAPICTRLSATGRA